MIVLIANEKGGVGKTTISVNLAAMCRLAGHDVLLVDTDRQESAGTWAAMRHENEFHPTITCVSKTGKVGRDLVELGQKYGMVIVDAGGRDSLEMRQALAVCDGPCFRGRIGSGGFGPILHLRCSWSHATWCGSGCSGPGSGVDSSGPTTRRPRLASSGVIGVCRVTVTIFGRSITSPPPQASLWSRQQQSR